MATVRMPSPKTAMAAHAAKVINVSMPHHGSLSCMFQVGQGGALRSTASACQYINSGTVMSHICAGGQCHTCAKSASTACKSAGTPRACPSGPPSEKNH